MINLLPIAKSFTKKGISVIATDAGKRAVMPWKRYQAAIATARELEDQFSNERTQGIAIICGAVSGNLEVIDVDVKYDVTGSLFSDLMNAISEVSIELVDRLMIVQTKSGGYHIYYRCSVIEGNQKLAQRPATPEEVKENPNEKVLVLIETRGEGGYVIAPPTEGYTLKQSKTIGDITPEEREVLLEICRSFNQYVTEQPKPTVIRSINDNYAITPWEDYNNRGHENLFEILDKHGWTRNDRRSTNEKIKFKRPGKTDSETSGDFHTGLNLFMVFTTSSVFEPGRGYKPASVFALLECNNDFKEAAKRLSYMGYGEKKQSFGGKLEQELFKKKQDGYNTTELIKFLTDSNYKKNDAEAKEIVETLIAQWGERLCIFWDVDDKMKLSINRIRFIDFLNGTGGFGLYFYDVNSTIYRIVRVKDGFVEESSTEQMKKFILDYIDGLPDTFDGGITPTDLKEIILKQYNNLFNEGFLEFLPSIKLDFLKDTALLGYYPFKNGVVSVNKDGVSIDTYKQINKVIWKNQVIDFHFSVIENFDPNTCEYAHFLNKISGEDEDRLIYCYTLIGYNLHKFKDPSKPFATVNAEETDNEKDGGGTGKGIFNKALSYLLRTVKLDGKTFDVGKNFSMQRVSLDTQLICVEDCDKRFDFEKFNSHLTEGSTVEKKNKDELYIDYKDSPKFIFNTNYSLNIQGNHGKRRSKVFEFAPFFGPGNTPVDFFHHLLFEDWDQDEWNRFYNLMFFCLSLYLLGGIKEVVGSEKMKRKQTKLAFTEEFLEWWDEYSRNGCTTWKSFKDLYHGFLNESEIDKKEYSSKRFKKAIEITSELFANRVQTRRNRGQNNQHELRLDHDCEGNTKPVLDIEQNELDLK